MFDRRILWSLAAATWLSNCASADNLLLNPGFEQRVSSESSTPAHWTAGTGPARPLQLSSVHFEGKSSAMLVDDGQEHMWRQDVVAPKDRRWVLSARVKAYGVAFGKGDYMRLYGHIIYKDQPYSTATHFYASAKPGSYDWSVLAVDGAARTDLTVDRIHVSVLGKFDQGRIFVDDVRLTQHQEQPSAAAQLANKIQDLQKQLHRVGPIDDTVDQAQAELSAALMALEDNPPAVEQATDHWQAAARATSHSVWAAMYPGAMSDDPVEAQMIYHGLGQDKAGCDRYLDKLELAGANGMYLSFGSWINVVYHSDILPVEPGWEKFDALTYFIDAAHRRGMKVFGYLAPFYGTHSITKLPGSIAIDHPEWLAKGPDSNMPTFPDPANPEVVDFMDRVYRELAARYELDGIGLDYIRYPTGECLNFDENNRRQILEQCGVDILQHENVMGDAEAWSKVQEFRAQNIGKVVRRVAATVRDARPGITVMACLISQRQWAREDFGQDWAVSSQFIDYASPMNYDDLSLDLDMLKDQKSTFAKTGAVWIPAIGGMPPVHQSWTISEWAKRVAVQRKLQPGGIIIYRIGDLDPAVAAFFGKGPFFSQAAFPPPPRR
ncbi:family 10 glycosylhydrolase [Pirellulales bacterium]|nr:family 10 glycosylhydrolase [Pirellulales bacterium]